MTAVGPAQLATAVCPAAAAHGHGAADVVHGLIATEVAREPRGARHLARRGLEGHAELADALDGLPSELRPLAVGLEELASIREGDPVHGGGRVDLATGDVWHQSPFAEPIDDEELEDEDRWLWLEALGRRPVGHVGLHRHPGRREAR